ncbi:substrate-binding periplasmic protein [Chitinimonas sp. JJ19]|uniref:substrate-binding periplasmic protein n=1 Tax=Chitinimonas sp. JJ19 TaxID=3109352 RepID=UPI00300361C1
MVCSTTTRRTLLTVPLWLYATTCQAAPIVLYADEAFPPYSYVEQGRLKGIYVDQVRAAVARLKQYQVELRPIPWERGLAELAQGRIFGLFASYRRSERAYIKHYSAPLQLEHVAVFCRQQVLQSPRTDWPRDYGDLRIGINQGFAMSDVFVQARQSGAIRVTQFKGNEENLLALAAGKTHCYVNDRLSILWNFKRLQRDPRIKASMAALDLRETMTLSSESAHVVFGPGETDATQKAFIADLDRELAQQHRSGEAQAIVARYLK